MIHRNLKHESLRSYIGQRMWVYSFPEKRHGKRSKLISVCEGGGVSYRGSDSVATNRLCSNGQFLSETSKKLERNCNSTNVHIFAISGEGSIAT